MDNLVTFFQTHVKDEFSLLILALCFLGGVVASLSPCGIGMLPGDAAYSTGREVIRYAGYGGRKGKG